MTFEELWEQLKTNPETKATIEEVDRNYKLFKEVEELVIADYEKKLKNKDQQISELEVKLSESESELQKYKIDEFGDAVCDFAYGKMTKTQLWKSIEEQHKMNMVLKQQLHNLPKKIVEEIRKTLNGNDIEIENNIWLTDILDTILKKYGGEDESICCNVKQ